MSNQWVIVPGINSGEDESATFTWAGPLEYDGQVLYFDNEEDAEEFAELLTQKAHDAYNDSHDPEKHKGYFPWTYVAFEMLPPDMKIDDSSFDFFIRHFEEEFRDEWTLSNHHHNYVPSSDSDDTWESDVWDDADEDDLWNDD